MAELVDIQAVRENTDEKDSAISPYADEFISDLIDSLGIAGASSEIWRKKAGSYAALVNVTEAGASRSLGDLQKKALDMAAAWSAQVPTDTATTGQVRVRKIVRS
jgi:hypothetical protein